MKFGMRKGYRSQETGIETRKTKSALSGDKSQERKAVFLPGRSCTDHVLTLTLIIKATIEEQNRLLTLFMDFKWVFERLHHDSSESNVNRYGKPAKIITIIKALYQG